MTGEPASTPGGPHRPGDGDGQLGVRTIDRTPPDIHRLAQAFIGVILARRFANREQAGEALASWPATHTPRRPAR